MITDGDFTCRMISGLPGDIHGAVRIDNDLYGNIYINDNLSPMAKRKAFEHELMHLQEDDFFNGKPISEIENK